MLQVFSFKRLLVESGHPHTKSVLVGFQHFLGDALDLYIVVASGAFARSVFPEGQPVRNRNTSDKVMRSGGMRDLGDAS